MDFYIVPIGFGLVPSANTAAMNRYAHLSESQKQDILNRAHNVRSEKEMYSLVEALLTVEWNKAEGRHSYYSLQANKKSSSAGLF